jgi:uncharacterized membrane protein YfcA
VIAGATADALGYGGAIAIVAALTAASGLWVLIDMPSKLHRAQEPAMISAFGGSLSSVIRPRRFKQ